MIVVDSWSGVVAQTEGEVPPVPAISYWPLGVGALGLAGLIVLLVMG